MGYWKRYKKKVNDKYGFFSNTYLQFQTLNIIDKVVLFCKRNATRFKHVGHRTAQLLLADWNRVTEY